jgi:hypothetical protein
MSTFYFILFFGVEMALPFIFFILWIRASLARLRFDQLLHLGWAHILPLTIAYILFLTPLLYTFDLFTLSMSWCKSYCTTLHYTWSNINSDLLPLLCSTNDYR